MKSCYLYLLLALLIVPALLLSCVKINQDTGDVPIYTFAPPNNQPGYSPQLNPPISSLPSSTDTGEEYIERNIVIDDRNNIFSIGIPAGYRENTEVTAQSPIDFWFEYLPAEAKLIVDGIEVQRNPFIWETKIRYTGAVTSFKYEISTGTYIAYNLHLLPAAAGAQIPVIVRQRWIP